MTQNVQISAKMADGTILVLGGESWQGFVDLVKEALGESGAEAVATSFFNLIPMGAGDAAVQQATDTVVRTFPGAQPVQQRQAAPPAPGVPGAPQCQHGPRQFKEGVGQKGPWRAWMCPLPQDRSAGRCPPAWIK